MTKEPLLEASAQTGGRISYVQCDVTNDESVKSAFDQAEANARYPIRGLVALAAISGRSSAVDYDVKAFRRIMDVNVTGSFLCAQAAARLFHRQMVSGSVVLFASMSASNVNRVGLSARARPSTTLPPISIECTDSSRASILLRTMRLSRHYSSWLETWLPNGDPTANTPPLE